jgi:beta-galactosidase
LGILLLTGAALDVCGQETVMDTRHVLELSPMWQIQPATSPDLAPRAGDWGSTKSAGWRWGKIHCLWYEQTVAVPEGWGNRRNLLHFKRIEGDAIVFVNAKRVGELLRPGGDIDVSEVLTPGQENTVRVFVTRNYTGISRDFAHDPLRYTARGPISHSPLPMEKWAMGITAPASLHSLPRPVSISDVFVRTSWREKTIALDVELSADAPVSGLQLRIAILDADGKEALTFGDGPFNLPAGQTVRTITQPWANPIPWELEAGYLYTARVSLDRNGALADAPSPIRFGFREVWTEGRNVYLNGHVSRWRVDWTACGLNRTSLSFFRLMGRNLFYTQANPSMWWRTWSETPLLSDDLLDAFDEQGMGSFVPAPGISYLRMHLITDPQAQRDYDREMRRWLRMYRNHPCILGWTIGMNSFCPRDGIHPDTMGKRKKYPPRSQADVIEKGLEIVKSHDPTRLVYSHADGNVGDISTSNSYLNFAPLQEREEWPSDWAKHGDMPYFPVEFGQPYTANFWKGKQFLMTEYLAMYFGDRAYRDESLAGLQRMVEISLTNKSGHGGAIPADEFPLYWDFQRLFVGHTDRSWRTWGVPGYYYWDFGIGYGNPPRWDGKTIWNRYSTIPEPLAKRPDWASPNFDIRAANEQSLLVWLAGAPQHTDKTHAFYGGETIRKQVAVVWDGPGEKTVDARWEFADDHGKVLQTGTVRLALKVGDIAFAPISLVAPTVTTRQAFTLSLTAKDGDKTVTDDKLAIQVFPPEPAAIQRRHVVLFDPAGKTAPWLKTLGVHFAAWQPGMELNTTNLLVLGRESLKQGTHLPYTAEEVAKGLRVLVLEQQPQIWEGLGFQAIETMPRYVFARDKISPILNGIAPEDLVNWRGNPNLLPERKPARSHEVMHAPKWTNTHAVASVVLQIPHMVGFSPVLVAEFDLDYSPLLVWQHGRGSVYYSTLDLTDRVGVDPAATHLARKLVETASVDILANEPFRFVGASTHYARYRYDHAHARRSSSAVRYVGDAKGRTLLNHLGVATDPKSSLVVVGSGGIPEQAELDGMAKQGATVLFLPRTAEELAAFGLKTTKADLVRTTVPDHRLFQGIGQNLLRWRDTLHVTTFAQDGQPDGANSIGEPVPAIVGGDGLFLIRRIGGGQQVFVQLDPFALDDRYPDDAPEYEAIVLSTVRLRQFWAQLLTNAGADCTAALAERLTTLEAGPAYQQLGHWYVLGPFAADAKKKPAGVLDTEYPGEKAAIAGDTNPNLTYTRADGKALDFRTTVQADKSDFMNLAATLKAGENSVAYATCTVNRDKAGAAVLRLGVDYWMKVWVNGELVYRMDHGHGSPKPNRHLVKAHLKAGENVITLKVLAGGKGFGFWANLADGEETDEQAAGVAKAEARLYDVAIRLRDPYEYHYW